MGRRGFASADREEIDEVVGELFGGFEGLPVRDVVDDLEAMREQRARRAAGPQLAPQLWLQENGSAFQRRSAKRSRPWWTGS
jgi:hypothetical protein